MTAILELSGVSRFYKSGANTLNVLQGADLSLQAGELVGLVGESGVGKSTLLHLAGLLEPPQEGIIRLEGVDCHSLSDRERTNLRRDKLGFIYQFHHLLPEFSAVDNITMPLMIAGWQAAAAKKKALGLLSQMGLEERAHHQPGQLSGGEQQRVAIARALANDPRLVIADEPTGNLDPGTTERVFATLIQLVRHEGAAVLVATHNMNLIPHMDRVVTLQDGKLVPYHHETPVA